ncbi:hypothetical protein NIG5292_00786 [Nereida ignava]|uniref:Uncharacterized protein n=1 Tax=Nereida ignava TaxID=282199 RepID=A0A0U1NJN7_9RHOB|nr:hypothetical protein NIG5292_00786 [Nereida ignava]
MLPQYYAVDADSELLYLNIGAIFEKLKVRTARYSLDCL